MCCTSRKSLHVAACFWLDISCLAWCIIPNRFKPPNCASFHKTRGSNQVTLPMGWTCCKIVILAFKPKPTRAYAVRLAMQQVTARPELNVAWSCAPRHLDCRSRWSLVWLLAAICSADLAEVSEGSLEVDRPAEIAQARDDKSFSFLD